MALTPESANRKDQNTGQNVVLQHRHFAFIASVIASMPDTNAAETDAKVRAMSAFADACALSNPRFDRARFVKACAV
jgi:hypothetical protein